MRITRLVINKKETQSLGLEPININSRKLGEVVALVGKNGAGKSRILSLIKNYCQTADVTKIASGHISKFPNFFVNSPEFDKFEDFPVNSLQSSPSLEVLIRNLNQFSNRYVKVVNHDIIKQINNKIDRAIKFEDVITSLRDFNISSKKNSPEYNEFDIVSSTQTISFINNLTDDVAIEEYSFYKSGTTNDEDKTRSPAYKNFLILKKYIRLFLDKEISYKDSLSKETRVLNTQILLNEKPFRLDQLSPGEKTLFAYAVLFFSYEMTENINPKDYIIIIDEPELHLHPGAQLKLINALRNLIKDTGQLWIATHSLAIVSHLNYHELLLVKSDSLVPPSTDNLEEMFTELMIVEEHRQELSDFINSLQSWAHARFIKECFTEPDVILTANKNDPQYKLFKDFIKDTGNLRLLDFGAGYGRVGTLIAEDKEMTGKVLYSAYEPNINLHNVLYKNSIIQNIYQKESAIPTNSFEIVLLCNVLHEIIPTDWIDALNSIKNVLTDNGYLIIIEDLHLPKGELANKFRYLILNNQYLDELMGFEGKGHALNVKLDNKRYRDRLVFYAVRKEQIKPDKISVWNTIGSLHEGLFDKIREIRDISKISDARLYANYCQQYINSKLILEELEELKYNYQG